MPVIKITSQARNFLKGDRLSFFIKKYTIKYPNLDLIKINYIDLSTNRKAGNSKENLNQIYFLPVDNLVDFNFFFFLFVNIKLIRN